MRFNSQQGAARGSLTRWQLCWGGAGTPRTTVRSTWGLTLLRPGGASVCNLPGVLGAGCGATLRFTWTAPCVCTTSIVRKLSRRQQRSRHSITFVEYLVDRFVWWALVKERWFQTTCRPLLVAGDHYQATRYIS